jgi:putative transport protein
MKIHLSLAEQTFGVGYKLLRIPYDELTGIVAGIQTQPAVLGFANKQCGTERPDIGYTSVFPLATIFKIIAAQLIVNF